MIRRWLTEHPAALSLLLVAVVFGIDLQLQLGVASAVPYTFAVLLALAARPRWFGPAIAGLCSVLTLVKMELSPDRGSTELWKVLTNRGLALFAIGMTTLLGLLRRQAEVRSREHQAALAQVGRLSLLGQVTANLAHELNQPLAALCLQADVASRLAKPGEPVRPELSAALAEVAEQAARAAAIVKGVRRLARGGDAGHDPVDLDAAVRNVVRLLEWRAARSSVVIELQLTAGQAVLHGSRILIEQVLFNLIQNAIEALATVTAGPRLVTVRTAADEETITATVRDTGPGLPNPEKAFEPFHTTKPDGMGLGLAISRSIAEAHGGRLTAALSHTGGAVFTLSLPLSQRDAS